MDEAESKLMPTTLEEHKNHLESSKQEHVQDSTVKVINEESSPKRKKAKIDIEELASQSVKKRSTSVSAAPKEIHRIAKTLSSKQSTPENIKSAFTVVPQVKKYLEASTSILHLRQSASIKVTSPKLSAESSGISSPLSQCNQPKLISINFNSKESLGAVPKQPNRENTFVPIQNMTAGDYIDEITNSFKETLGKYSGLKQHIQECSATISNYVSTLSPRKLRSRSSSKKSSEQSRSVADRSRSKDVKRKAPQPQEMASVASKDETKTEVKNDEEMMEQLCIYYRKDRRSTSILKKVKGLTCWPVAKYLELANDLQQNILKTCKLLTVKNYNELLPKYLGMLDFPWDRKKTIIKQANFKLTGSGVLEVLFWEARLHTYMMEGDAFLEKSLFILTVNTETKQNQQAKEEKFQENCSVFSKLINTTLSEKPIDIDHLHEILNNRLIAMDNENFCSHQVKNPSKLNFEKGNQEVLTFVQKSEMLNFHMFHLMEELKILDTKLAETKQFITDLTSTLAQLKEEYIKLKEIRKKKVMKAFGLEIDWPEVDSFLEQFYKELLEETVIIEIDPSVNNNQARRKAFLLNMQLHHGTVICPYLEELIRLNAIIISQHFSTDIHSILAMVECIKIRGLQELEKAWDDMISKQNELDEVTMSIQIKQRPERNGSPKLKLKNRSNTHKEIIMTNFKAIRNLQANIWTEKVMMNKILEELHLLFAYYNHYKNRGVIFLESLGQLEQQLKDDISGYQKMRINILQDLYQYKKKCRQSL